MMSLAACGAESPSRQVKRDIKDIQKAEISSTLFDSEDSGFDEDEKEGYKDFLGKLSDFDYEIVEEKISEEGEIAVVTVDITTYDFGTAYLDSWDEVASGKVKNGETFYTLFFGKISELEEKNFTTRIAVNCSKNDKGGWTTDLASNADFRKAIFGDLIDVVSDLANM